jgi:hypothetical protein
MSAPRVMRLPKASSSEPSDGTTHRPRLTGSAAFQTIGDRVRYDVPQPPQSARKYGGSVRGYRRVDFVWR